MATSWSAGAETGKSNIYYARPVAEPPSLRPFTALQPQVFKSIRVDSLLSFAEEQSALGTDGARQLYFTTSSHLDVQLLLESHELWVDALKPIEAVPGLMLSLVFQPLTEGILFHSAQRGGNALGLTPDDGPLVITLLNSVHKDPADDDRVVGAVLALISEIKAAAARRGNAVRYCFTKFAYRSQRIFEWYGSRSVAAWQAMSRRYDPNGFFQRTVPRGLKIYRVYENLSDGKDKVRDSITPRSSTS